MKSQGRTGFLVRYLSYYSSERTLGLPHAAAYKDPANAGGYTANAGWVQC